MIQKDTQLLTLCCPMHRKTADLVGGKSGAQILARVICGLKTNPNIIDINLPFYHDQMDCSQQFNQALDCLDQQLNWFIKDEAQLIE